MCPTPISLTGSLSSTERKDRDKRVRKLEPILVVLQCWITRTGTAIRIHQTAFRA